MRIGAQSSHTGIMPSGHVLAQAAQFALRFANELRLYNVIGVFGVLDQRSQGHSVPQVAGTGLGTDRGPSQTFRQPSEKTMDECMRHINAEHDVDGLCRSFPKRLGELRSSKGERMKY